MILEGSPIISIYLNGIDLVERAADSVVWPIVPRKALQLIHVLLLPNFRRSPTLDSLRRVLFGSAALVVDEDGVHLRPLSNEVVDRLAVRLVLVFANHFVVGRVEEWARLVERGEVEEHARRIAPC